MRRLLANTHPARLAFCLQGSRVGLIELADAIGNECGLLSDALADAYFQHASRHRTGAAGSR